jgi:hypothetical protein
LWSKRVLLLSAPIPMRENFPVFSGLRPEKISNH